MILVVLRERVWERMQAITVNSTQKKHFFYWSHPFINMKDHMVLNYGSFAFFQYYNLAMLPRFRLHIAVMYLCGEMLETNQNFRKHVHSPKEKKVTNWDVRESEGISKGQWKKLKNNVRERKRQWNYQGYFKLFFCSLYNLHYLTSECQRSRPLLFLKDRWGFKMLFFFFRFELFIAH